MLFFLCISGFMIPYFSYFALSYQPYLIAWCLAFKYFYYPDFKLDLEVTSLLTNFHHFDPFFVLISPFFLLCFFYSQPYYFAETLPLTLPLMCLLVTLLITSFLIIFTTEPLLCLGFPLISSVLCLIFATLCKDA